MIDVAAEVHIDQVVELFRDLPREVEARVYLKAAQAGGGVLVAEVANRTPVEEGELRAALDHAITVDSQLRGVRFEITFGKQTYKAGWVEYGHRQLSHRWRVVRRAKRRGQAGSLRRERVQQRELGTVQPHPFLRPSVEVAFDDILDAVTEVVREELALS